jgi:benzoate-CoA ligase
MAMQSEVDHSVSPPRITIPRDYNAAVDLIDRNLRSGARTRLRITTTTVRIHLRLNWPNASTASPARSSHWAADGAASAAVPSRHDRLPGLLPWQHKGWHRSNRSQYLAHDADYGYMLHDSRALALVVSESLLPTFAPLLGEVAVPEACDRIGC